jgi:hypothetical protein
VGRRARLTTVARQCGVAALLTWNAAREDGRIDADEDAALDRRLHELVAAVVAADEADGLFDAIRRGVNEDDYFADKLSAWRAAVDELPESA